jgi:hypothetical protein
MLEQQLVHSPEQGSDQQPDLLKEAQRLVELLRR